LIRKLRSFFNVMSHQHLTVRNPPTYAPAHFAFVSASIIERRKRFVEQKDVRITNQCPGKLNTLCIREVDEDKSGNPSSLIMRNIV
jgi:hypothetical protein